MITEGKLNVEVAVQSSGLWVPGLGMEQLATGIPINETHIHTVYAILFSHTWAHIVHYEYKCMRMFQSIK